MRTSSDTPSLALNADADADADATHARPWALRRAERAERTLSRAFGARIASHARAKDIGARVNQCRNT